MIPFIIIVVVALIIFGAVQGARSSGSSKKHSSYRSDTMGRDQPVPSVKKAASAQNNYAFEKQQAQSLMKQLHESADLINTTTNPKTYFGRVGFAFDTLLELTKYEKYDIFTGSTPTDDLNKMKNNLEISVNAFIDRSYEAQLIKISTLKTQQGKKNSLNNYFDSMFSAFDCAKTFWTGDNHKPHYTGELYTKCNLNYLKSLHEDCVKLYALESVEISMPVKEKKVLVFDTDKENELLSEYRKYENDESSDKYYTALPLIDFYYKYRELDESYLDLCIEYCNICISLLSVPDMQSNVSEGMHIPAFKKLVIIYEKKKDYSKALAVIEEAIKYDREVEYYEKKKASILKKTGK